MRLQDYVLLLILFFIFIIFKFFTDVDDTYHNLSEGYRLGGGFIEK